MPFNTSTGPVSVCSSLPFVVFQILAVRSFAADANVVPSGE
jgi:hypothetical protein